MGYSEDYSDYELDAQGEEVGLDAPMSEHEIMCERFGYSPEDFAQLSNKDRQQFLWNWKNVQQH